MAFSTKVGSSNMDTGLESVDERLLRSLMTTLQGTKDLRYSTELTRKALKSKLSAQFKRFHNEMDYFEKKITNKIDGEYIQREIELPLNKIEHDIQKLIVDVTSVYSKSRSEQRSMIEKVDSEINQLNNKLISLESYKRMSLDNLVKEQPDVNDFLNSNVHKLETFLTEPILSKSPNQYQWNDWDYKRWLQHYHNNLNDFETRIGALKEANSFEVLNLDDDDSIDFADELMCSYQPDHFDTNENSGQVTRVDKKINPKIDMINDNLGIGKALNEIYSRPLDYWSNETQNFYEKQSSKNKQST